MDSLTQFALGAAVGAAVLGRRMGVRRAALAGGVLGTLPDLDFLFPSDGPVDSFVSHRGASHSLVMQALATPVLGEALRLMSRPLRDARGSVWLTVYLCLSTHALLDALTIYGTRLFWPVTNDAVGLGSLFIIDPLYTLPLLVVTVWAFCLRSWTPHFGKALTVALALSTGYAAWSAVAQHIAEGRGDAYLRARGVTAEHLVATPAPFSTLLWRVIAVDGPRNFNVYIPLLGGPDATTAYGYTRWPAEIACWVRRSLAEDEPLRRLASFTDEFYEIRLQDGAVVFADLRMGLAPRYAFQFELARHGADGTRAVPPRRLRTERSSPGDGDWLRDSIAGARVVRPAERDHLLDAAATLLAPPPRVDC